MRKYFVLYAIRAKKIWVLPRGSFVDETYWKAYSEQFFLGISNNMHIVNNCFFCFHWGLEVGKHFLDSSPKTLNGCISFGFVLVYEVFVGFHREIFYKLNFL